MTCAIWNPVLSPARREGNAVTNKTTRQLLGKGSWTSCPFSFVFVTGKRLEKATWYLVSGVTWSLKSFSLETHLRRWLGPTQGAASEDVYLFQPASLPACILNLFQPASSSGCQVPESPVHSQGVQSQEPSIAGDRVPGGLREPRADTWQSYTKQAWHQSALGLGRGRRDEAKLPLPVLTLPWQVRKSQASPEPEGRPECSSLLPDSSEPLSAHHLPFLQGVHISICMSCFFAGSQHPLPCLGPQVWDEADSVPDFWTGTWGPRGGQLTLPPWCQWWAPWWTHDPEQAYGGQWGSVPEFFLNDAASPTLGVRNLKFKEPLFCCCCRLFVLMQYSLLNFLKWAIFIISLLSWSVWQTYWYFR